MNNVYFKTEDEKREYVEKIFGMIGPLQLMVSELTSARESGENLENIYAKAENLVHTVQLANMIYQSTRDSYREENTMLTYGQEKAIINCLHDTATTLYKGEYEATEGAWYNLTQYDLYQGDALKKEFIKELQNLDLSQSNGKKPKVR